MAASRTQEENKGRTFDDLDSRVFAQLDARKKCSRACKRSWSRVTRGNLRAGTESGHALSRCWPVTEVSQHGFPCITSLSLRLAMHWRWGSKMLASSLPQRREANFAACDVDGEHGRPAELRLASTPPSHLRAAVDDDGQLAPHCKQPDHLLPVPPNKLIQKTPQNSYPSPHNTLRE